jgi:dTDP-4-amino-4,6-dideoxygalactose transaminase
VKSRVDDLAVFGGRPAFAEPLHVGRPNAVNTRGFHERMHDAFERRWLSNDGPLVAEFERRIADAVGVEHCVAVSSGTSAIEVLVRAAGLDGEVIVPSFTFVGTAHALLWSGLRPRFCDIDPDSHNIDPERVEELVGPRTSAILGVHVWGRPCAIEALQKIATANGLGLYFDAAHGFACTHGGRMLGSFGGAEVMSFHATKVVHAFEGGAITTDDPDLAERARLVRNFGFGGYDEVVVLGTNAKMSEASAAMGLTSIDGVDDVLATNRRNHAQYRARLAELPGVTVIGHDRHEQWNHHYVVLEIDRPEAGLSRDTLQRVLTAEGVLARRYFYPGVHAMEPYRTIDPSAGMALPATEQLVRRVLCLPTGNAVSPNEIDDVCEIVRTAIEHAPDVRRRLPPGLRT